MREGNIFFARSRTLIPMENAFPKLYDVAGEGGGFFEDFS